MVYKEVTTDTSSNLMKPLVQRLVLTYPKRIGNGHSKSCLYPVSYTLKKAIGKPKIGGERADLFR